MLVSAIGYFNSNSKSLYGVEPNKTQSKSNLNEGFGHETASLNIKNNSNVLMNLTSSIQSLFSSKSDECKKYLSLIG